MDAFIALCAKFVTVLFGLLFVAELVRNFFVKKIVNSIFLLDDARKLKLSQADSTVMSVYKIFFWLTPIYLLVIPAIIYFYFPEIFFYFTVALFLMYGVLLQDFLYRRNVWKSIGKMESEKK